MQDSSVATHTAQVFVPASQPSASGTAGAADHATALELFIFLGWLVAALIVSPFTGLFRRCSVRGPERLSDDESAWYLVMFGCGGILLAGRLAALFKPTFSDLRPDAVTLINTAIFELIAVVIIVALNAIFRKHGTRKLGLLPRQLPAGIAGGGLAGFIIFPMVLITMNVVMLLYPLIYHREPPSHEVLKMIGNGSDHRVLWTAVLMASVAAPMTEELLFRGLIQTVLGRLCSFAFGPIYTVETATSAELPTPASASVGVGAQSSSRDSVTLDYSPDGPPLPRQTGGRARWCAIAITAALFAAIHGEPAFMPPIFVLAVGLGYIYERTGNLWMPITVHSLFNSLQIVYFLHR